MCASISWSTCSRKAMHCYPLARVLGDAESLRLAPDQAHHPGIWAIGADGWYKSIVRWIMPLMGDMEVLHLDVEIGIDLEAEL